MAKTIKDNNSLFEGFEPPKINRSKKKEDENTENIIEHKEEPLNNIPSETERILEANNMEVFPYPKRSVGKPKKRKAGEKKMSFWIDEDLVNGIFGNLSYGDSAGEFINRALREYLESHNLI